MKTELESCQLYGKLTHYLDVVLILNERAESLGLDGAPCLSFLMSRDLLKRESECSAHRALSNAAAVVEAFKLHHLWINLLVLRCHFSKVLDL